MLMAEMRHTSSAEAPDMAAAKTAAKASDATSTEAAAEVTATKSAAHMSATESAAHVTATKAPATHMATATTAACLCTGGEKAAGHNSGCQDLHYSSSHETLLCDGQGFCHRTWSGAGMSELDDFQRHDRPEVGMPSRRFD
jgi:hypothetical protein